MRARATSTNRTAERILDVAKRMFVNLDYDAVGLQAIAEGAGVTLRTVLRRFGSKDALLVEVSRHFAAEEAHSRVVASGDARGAARVLAVRYEATMDIMARYWPLELRIPAVGAAITKARKVHLAWLADGFAPFLPRREGVLRERRLAELFGATEIFVWYSLRRHLGLDARAAEAAMVETLEALISQWAKSTGR